MATVVPENWRYGELTEDKKLPIRFLDADGDPIALVSLVGYGVEVFTKAATIVKCGVNMPDSEYTDELLVPVDAYTFMVAMEGALLPQSQKEVYALTTVIFTDPDMPEGVFIDHCDTVPVVYHAVKKQNNSLT